MIVSVQAFMPTVSNSRLSGWQCVEPSSFCWTLGLVSLLLLQASSTNELSVCKPIAFSLWAVLKGEGYVRCSPQSGITGSQETVMYSFMVLC